MPLTIKFGSSQSFSKTFQIVAMLFLVTLAACQTKKVDEKNEKYYYDLKGFMENQIVYLEEKKPEVSKTAVLNGKTEQIKTKEIDWKKELELFVQADINKPSYRFSYNVSHRDSAEYEYKLRPGIQANVQYLKIVTDSVVNQPVYVKAVLKSENRIYESEKIIELRYAQINNLWQLSSFSVNGYQKLIFTDKKSFHITSKIGL